MNVEQQSDSFKHYAGLSLIGHTLVILFFTIKTVFFPSEDLIIQSAVRVDLVALPDKKIDTTPSPPEPPKPTPAPSPKTKESTKPKKPDPRSTKDQQKKAIERLKAKSAIDKIKNEDTKKEIPKEKPEELYKGNVVTSGSSLKGLDKLQYDEYFGRLEQHVKNHWVLPQWLADKDLRTQVLVKIDERGFVTSKEIMTSSGDQVFDNMALEAVEKSSPAPVAPTKLQNLIATQGVVFNFP